MQTHYIKKNTLLKNKKVCKYFKFKYIYTVNIVQPRSSELIETSSTLDIGNIR